ncbi:MAG TPA: O-antigen polymerase [Planctomycetota bacterium]|nr:O-antigen polymerase [Planctomycetota bacterium]
MDKNTGARVSTELTNAPAALHEVEGGARRVLVLVAIPILAAIYCGIALVAQPEADAFVLLWILICALLLAVPLVLERRLDPFSPAFFFVFLRVQWVGKPCLETLFGSYSNRYLENLTQLETFELLRGALVIVALGLFGYWVGYYGGVSRLLPEVRLGLPERFHRRRLATLIVLLTCAVAFVYGLFIVQAGGFRAMWNVMGERREVYAGVKVVGWVLDIASLPLILLVVLRGDRRPRWLVPACAALVLALAATGDRSRALVPALIVIIFWHYSIRRIRPILLMGLAFAIVVLAVAIRDLRGTSFGGREVDFTVIEESVTAPTLVVERFVLGRGTVDIIGVLLHLMPERLPFQHGATYIRALVMPIPRALWPDKPLVDESGLVGRAFFGPDYYGLPVGTEGVLYMNFHLPGVLLGMIFLGALHRRIYESLRARLHSPAHVILYACALYFLSAFTGIGLFNLATIVVPVWLALRFAGARGARADSHDAAGSRTAPAPVLDIPN